MSEKGQMQCILIFALRLGTKSCQYRSTAWWLETSATEHIWDEVDWVIHIMDQQLTNSQQMHDYIGSIRIKISPGMFLTPSYILVLFLNILDIVHSLYNLIRRQVLIAESPLKQNNHLTWMSMFSSGKRVHLHDSFLTGQLVIKRSGSCKSDVATIENKVEELKGFKLLRVQIVQEVGLFLYTIVKLGVQRIHLLHTLNSFHVCKTVLSDFSSAFMESPFTFSFICWFRLTAKDRSSLNSNL